MQVRVVIGMNQPWDKLEQLQHTVNQTEKSLKACNFSLKRHRLEVQLFAFTHAVNAGVVDPITPLGHIRNHLLDKLIDHTKGNPVIMNINGDAHLTTAAVETSLYIQPEHFTAIGYDVMDQINSTSQDAL